MSAPATDFKSIFQNWELESKSSLSKIKRNDFIPGNIKKHLKRYGIIPERSDPNQVLDHLKGWMVYKGYYKPLYNKCNTIDELLGRITAEYLFIREVDKKHRIGASTGSLQDLYLLKKVQQQYPHPIQARTYHGLHYFYRSGSKTLILANIYKGCQQLILYDSMTDTMTYGQCLVKYKVQPDRLVFNGDKIKYTAVQKGQESWNGKILHECESIAPYFTAIPGTHRQFNHWSRVARMPSLCNFTTARYNLGMFDFVNIPGPYTANANANATAPAPATGKIKIQIKRR